MLQQSIHVRGSITLVAVKAGAVGSTSLPAAKRPDVVYHQTAIRGPCRTRVENGMVGGEGREEHESKGWGENAWLGFFTVVLYRLALTYCN